MLLCWISPPVLFICAMSSLAVVWYHSCAWFDFRELSRGVFSYGCSREGIEGLRGSSWTGFRQKYSIQFPTFPCGTSSLTFGLSTFFDHCFFLDALIRAEGLRRVFFSQSTGTLYLWVKVPRGWVRGWLFRLSGISFSFWLPHFPSNPCFYCYIFIVAMATVDWWCIGTLTDGVHYTCVRLFINFRVLLLWSRILTQQHAMLLRVWQVYFKVHNGFIKA